MTDAEKAVAEDYASAGPAFASATYYSLTEDDEELFCAGPDDAIREWLYVWTADYEPPETVDVYAYKRVVLAPDEPRGEGVLEDRLDWLGGE